MLALAAILLITIGLAHSYLGEKYILTRLFRQQLPPLFGDDTFTKATLRFAWHITTVAWFGFAAILLVLHSGIRFILLSIASVFLVSGLIALIGSRGRHLSWVVFFLVAALCAIVAVDA